MAKAPDARTFGQDLMRGEHVVGAVPGGGSKVVREGSRDAYKLKTANGYQTAAEMAASEEGIDQAASGTSIFDPVLTELMYTWFCPPKGHILDPFSGGSVRGIVASKLGRAYTGIDLSARQLEANREQAVRICAPEQQPEWIHGSSADIEELAAHVQPDMIFSCPPYAMLERYSDDPRDLSTMSYEEFVDAYRQIIAACIRKLRPNRFACFVVGDVRDKKGNYYGFPNDTVRAFQDAGAPLYNSAILVTAVGSLPVRTTKQFNASRKLGKTHQEVFVFLKGDAKRATEAIGKVD